VIPLELSRLFNDCPDRVAFSPKGNILASAGCEFSDTIIRTINLWDISDPTKPSQVATITRNIPEIDRPSFSSDGNTLASVGTDNAIILWDISNLTAITLSSTTTLAYQLFGIVFSPVGDVLASVGCEKFDGYGICTKSMIVLWDTSDPKIPKQLATLIGNGQGNAAHGTAFSTDGRTLVVRGSNLLTLWDITNPTAPSQIANITDAGNVVEIALSPDNKTLATDDNSDTITLWDISNLVKPQKLIVLQGPAFGAVEDIAFSPDSKIIASANDSILTLWDVSNLSAPTHLTDLKNDGVTIRVAFSPDGQILASSGGTFGRDMITLWDLNPESWIKKACQIVRRNFTRAEWLEYFHSEEYRATCPQWPLEPEATPIPSVAP
jgi:WD40 repeat protein